MFSPQYSLVATHYFQHYLAEVCAAFQVLEGLAGVGHGKDAIDHGAELVQRDCPVHGFEHGPTADKDALAAALFHKAGHGVDLTAGAGETADEADVAACADGPERFAQGAGPADLDDMVDTLTGEL